MRKTVMIVDEEQPFHDLYTKMLEGSNYRMVNVYDGYEALSKLEDKRPDLIISDITLNMITGDTLFLHLKSIWIRGYPFHNDDRHFPSSL